MVFMVCVPFGLHGAPINECTYAPAHLRQHVGISAEVDAGHDGHPQS